MKLGVRDYIAAAFNTRPIGMIVAPNWIGLGFFALLGLVSPGFWLLGLGFEMAYLYTIAFNPRFQRVVDAQRLSDAQRQWLPKLEDLIGELAPEDQARYRALERRCRSILYQKSGTDAPPTVASQVEGLRRLLWIYLRLLLTRQSINKVLNEAAGGPKTIDERAAQIEARLQKDGLEDDLRKSLTGQLDILKQRMHKQKEAREKLAFLEAELTRIQEQVELIREQAVLSTDPEGVSHRIDSIAETLGGTMQWIQEQQKVYGNVEDLLAEPPPIPMEPTAKEST